MSHKEGPAGNGANLEERTYQRRGACFDRLRGVEALDIPHPGKKMMLEVLARAVDDDGITTYMGRDHLAYATGVHPETITTWGKELQELGHLRVEPRSGKYGRLRNKYTLLVEPLDPDAYKKVIEAKLAEKAAEKEARRIERNRKDREARARKKRNPFIDKARRTQPSETGTQTSDSQDATQRNGHANQSQGLADSPGVDPPSLDSPSSDSPARKTAAKEIPAEKPEEETQKRSAPSRSPLLDPPRPNQSNGNGFVEPPEGCAEAAHASLAELGLHLSPKELFAHGFEFERGVLVDWPPWYRGTPEWFANRPTNQYVEPNQTAV